MTFRELPASAAWRHHSARQGFEWVLLESHRSGFDFDGHAAGLESGSLWAVHYKVELDERWRTRAATVSTWTAHGDHETRLEADGAGLWVVNGSPMAALDGCLDVDLEASVCTNTIPVHRLQIDPGVSAEAPAAYVRLVGDRIDRLEQTYERIADRGDQPTYRYLAPAFDVDAEIAYDASGLVDEYPGIATRAH
jgi:uncharacterized protein